MAAHPASGAYVIDGDSHVLEPPSLWEEYLEPAFRPRAIRITRSISEKEPGHHEEPVRLSRGG